MGLLLILLKLKDMMMSMTSFEDLPDIISGLYPVPRWCYLGSVGLSHSFLGYRMCGILNDSGEEIEKYYWEKIYIGNILGEVFHPHTKNYENNTESQDFKMSLNGLTVTVGYGMININFDELIRYGTRNSRLN